MTDARPFGQSNDKDLSISYNMNLTGTTISPAMLLSRTTLITPRTGPPRPSKLTVIKSQYRQFYTHHTRKPTAATSPSQETLINNRQPRNEAEGMDAKPP